MLDMVFPRVYFNGDWKFLAVIGGKSVEYSITEYEAMGLAASILRASQAKARPEELTEHDRHCAI